MRTWQIDPSHSSVEFAVRHLMISTVKGRFGEVSGQVVAEQDDPAKINVDVSIPVASIDTREPQRDAHLRSSDFLEAERYPTINFVGRRLSGDPKRGFKLIGDLTIRGVTKEATLDVTSEGAGVDPWGNERAGYSATGKIDRRDFGLTWNQALETGGILVGDEVKISLNVELMRPKAA
jgi:polyisoprenoid-binding protein YceI